MISTNSIGHLDRCRRPSTGTASTEQWAKEWHHIVVHGDEVQLLVNLSETASGTGSPVTRCIVMAHTHGWHTSVSTADQHEVEMNDQVLDAIYGVGTRLWWQDDHYRLIVGDLDHDCTMDLRLDPLAQPAMLTGVTMSPTERLSWFFVPRLLATGVVTIGADHFEISQALAYHDHNWGHLAWGGDYSWEWISGVASDWSVTASRLLDGHQNRLTSQYLHVECDGASVTFRDAEIACVHEGRRRDIDVPVVPGPMRLITPSLIEDVPLLMHWRAARGGDHVDLTITTKQVARLAIPSERHVDRVIVLAEVLGSVELQGTIGDTQVQGNGHAVLELLR